MSMCRRENLITVLTKIVCCLFVASTQVSIADDMTELQPLLKTYCFRCHDATTQKGDLRLDRLSKTDADVFQAIYERIASKEMPPDDQRQPTAQHRTTLMKHSLDLASHSTQAVSTGFRRLNKREYANTVRDLLGSKNGTFDPGEYIYDDEIDEGFDTQAEALVISNELLIEYMSAAEKSLRQALFTPDTTRPTPRTVNVNLQKMQGSSRRYINTHPQYAITRCSGKECLFAGQQTRTMTAPGRYKITVTASGVDRDRYPVRFQPAKGPLILGIGVAQDSRQSVALGSTLLKTYELKDDVEQTFKFDTWIDKGYYPFLKFVNGPSKPITQVRSNIRRRKLKPSAMKEPHVGPGVKVTQLTIKGPFHDEWPPASIRTTYDSNTIPNLAVAEVRKRLVLNFARRAFRRDVGKAEVADYIRYLENQHATTGDWHEAVIKTFAAMMASIDFLYIREDPGELNSYQLANRLSYFFWSTMPDDELSALAKSGALTKPSASGTHQATVLGKQVIRMLDDPASSQFSRSFADQWLALDKLGSMPPDAKGEFREYYRQNLEAAMLKETRQYFQYILRENKSVRYFIDSDFSFVNKALADLYGVPFSGKDRKSFQRVTFPAQAKRGGLLGHASILTLSANGVETSPIERGVWVLSELPGTPPPPPPKEVPALTPDLNGAVSIREMLEKHRSDPACMECHRRMDPPGFALEAFDPIGRLRTKYSKKQPIDTRGSYLGEDFTDVTQLKQILSKDIRPFARNLTIRLAEYAKGRKLVASDYSTVEQLVEQAAKNDFKFKDLIVAIATSDLMTER